MENKRRLTGKIVFWFTPAAACLLVEILGHGGLPQIKMLFLNMVFFYMLYLVTYAVFNNEKIVYPFWNTAFFILALAEYYVLQFRDRPIMPVSYTHLHNPLYIFHNKKTGTDIVNHTDKIHK